MPRFRQYVPIPIVQGRPNDDRAGFRSRGGTGSDNLAHLAQIAYWLDQGFHIPGVGIRFGWDAIAKLVPVFGDMLGLVASLYLFQQIRQFNLPRITQARMAVNIGIDYFVGMLPLVGTVFDLFWKPNVWNVALLRRHLSAPHPAALAKARRKDWLFVLITVFVVTTLFVASAMLAYWLLLSIVHLLQTL
jgi:hypothetical protein